MSESETNCLEFIFELCLAEAEVVVADNRVNILVNNLDNDLDEGDDGDVAEAA